jgi:hypothetical protein
LSLTDGHRIIAGRDFRLNPILIIPRKNQQASLCTRVFDRRARERVDQFALDDLPPEIDQ